MTNKFLNISLIYFQITTYQLSTIKTFIALETGVIADDGVAVGNFRCCCYAVSFFKSYNSKFSNGFSYAG